MHVLDAPPNSMRPDISRDQIVSRLMDRVNSGQVSITLGGVTVKPSLRRRGNVACQDDDDSGLGTGAVVGLSIGLFIVGLLIGIALSFLLQWLLKHKGKLGSYGVSPYNKHKDEALNN